MVPFYYETIEKIIQLPNQLPMIIVIFLIPLKKLYYMKNVLLLLSTVLIFIGCSTNNNGTVTVVPIAPTNLIGTVISTSQVNLSWTDNATNEDGYKIERKSGSGSYAVVGSTGVNLTTFSDLGLTPNTTYTYRVYAYNSAGNSLQYSNEVTVTTQDNIPSWLTNGLVAFYPFSGNANDESGNGNNLITNGSITYSNNHIGTSNSACYFSNGNNYFTTPSSSWTLINNLPKGTVSFWIKIDSQYTSNHYFGIGNSFMIKEEWGVGEDLFFGMQDGSTKVRMQITGVFPGSQSTDVFGNTSLAINTWNHIVGVWDGLYHTLYINGIQDGRISNSNGIPNRPNPAYFSIGTCFFGGNGSTSQPSGTYGSMSNLRFYNRALNQVEITYLSTH